MAIRDLSVGACWRRLHANGYAATAARFPDRIVTRFARPAERESFVSLAAEPAAILCHPTFANGASEALDDLGARGVAILVATAYLLSDSRQAKPALAVLAEYGLTGGPVSVDSFGNRRYLLRWNGPPIFEGEASARLVHDDDDQTILLQHAIAPTQYTTATDRFARTHRVPLDPVGSHIMALEGKWENGHPLDTPRDQLPELVAADLQRLIADVERARWDARPAVQREAAA